MITDELVAYIQKQLDKGISKENISSRLTFAGWEKSDVEEGFAKLESPKIEEPIIYKTYKHKC